MVGDAPCHVSLLAGRTVVARALSLIEMTYGGCADSAGLFVALIDEEFLGEIPGCAIDIDVVTQRRAAGANRRAQHGAHGAYQTRRFRPRQAACLALRADAGAKQSLARVNVAHSDDELAVHQQLFD